MKIGILGSGVVAETLGKKLASLGHEVMISGRAAHSDKARALPYGDFAAAAQHGELVFNATKGEGSLAAVRAARDGLRGKILVDVSNPLDFSRGFPPTLTVCNTDSLGEQLQRELPETRVVKSLNTVNCEVMVDPRRAGGDSDLFVSGNDAGAKATVAVFLREQLGWSRVVDLGDIGTARGTEAYLLLWIRLYGALKTADFNLRLVRP